MPRFKHEAGCTTAATQSYGGRGKLVWRLSQRLYRARRNVTCSRKQQYAADGINTPQARRNAT
ncbi:MAG: hypothetical protein HG422_09855 [Prevotella sp.]|nr:hypothetical protein [Prevotella sp.]